MNEENWKAIPGHEDLYEASDLGNIRSLNYNHTGKTKVLSPGTSCKGYLRVNLCKNGKMKQFYVHTLVFSTFNGQIPPGLTVDHVNGIKTDNRPENLQLLTREENTRKAHKGKTPWNKGKPAWNKGIPHSEAVRAKMSSSQKARWQREKEGIIGHIYHEQVRTIRKIQKRKIEM